MSGRAGRRGLDTEGNAVIICSKELPDKEDLKKLVAGKVDDLESHFYVRPNMVLNLVRVQGLGMVDMLKRSLSANNVVSKIPEKKESLARFEKVLQEIEGKENIREIDEMLPFARSALDLQERIANVPGWCNCSKRKGVKRLEKGRVVYVLKNLSKNFYGLKSGSETLDWDIAVVVKDSTGADFEAQTTTSSRVKFKLADVAAVYSKTLGVEKLTQERMLDNLKKLRCEEPVPYSTMTDKASDIELAELESLFAKLRRFQYYKEGLNTHQKECVKSACLKIFVTKRIDQLRKELSEDSAPFMNQLNSHKRMLERLGCIQNDVITLRGRICIEIQSVADEVLCATLLCAGFFEGQDPEDIAALCSCLVGQRVGLKNEEAHIPENLEGKVSEMKEMGEKITEAMAEEGIDYNEETWLAEHVNEFVLGPTLAWAHGADLTEVMKEAESIPEGAMIRVLSQTAQLLTNMANAATIMGNRDVAEQFWQANSRIERGIVFCSSLYLD
jgi:superfamily II RNA helicase